MSYVDQIFGRFGGVRAMSRAVGKPVSTVASWKRRGSIPDSQKPDVLAAAIKAGIPLRPEDFFPQVTGIERDDGQEDAA